MPPKGVSKTVSKRCPECKRQMPVASRCCLCGHQFFEERRKSTASNNSEIEEIDEGSHSDARTMATGQIDSSSPAVEVKRRSERVKREKPNFYDSLEYDNKMRKARKEKQKEESSNINERMKRERKIRATSDYDDDDDIEQLLEHKKKKRKKNGDRKEEEAEDDIMAGISIEKEQQYGIVLCDINMKLGLNNPMCFI